MSKNKASSTFGNVKWAAGNRCEPAHLPKAHYDSQKRRKRNSARRSEGEKLPRALEAGRHEAGDKSLSSSAAIINGIRPLSLRDIKAVFSESSSAKIIMLKYGPALEIMSILLSWLGAHGVDDR